MDISSKIAQGLLSIGAVFLRPQEPFIWASGIKSPIYCDNRLILTAPAVRDTVERAIADTVRREFPQAEVLMGTATAGIAHAAIAAHLLGLPAQDMHAVFPSPKLVPSKVTSFIAFLQQAFAGEWWLRSP